VSLIKFFNHKLGVMTSSLKLMTTCFSEKTIFFFCSGVYYHFEV